MTTSQDRPLTHDDLARFASLVMEREERLVEVQKEHAEYVNMLHDKLKAHTDMPKAEAMLERIFIAPHLHGACFVGHINTDLDSVAGAIGAAHLFEGTAARAEEAFNGEISAGLEFAGLEAPPVFDAIEGVENLRVCLVDHNEEKQMTRALRTDPKRMSRIVGLIDHHAIASSFVSSSPLYIEMRPWGAMATIVAWLHWRNNVAIPKSIARIILCAILSDTLNLKSSTTTKADEFAVALLTRLGEVDDIDALAHTLFHAKTAWIVGLGAYEMIRGDQKDFEAAGLRFSISVLEVTDIAPVMNIAEDLVFQLRVFKYEKGDSADGGAHDCESELHLAFLFVVHTVEQYSFVIVCGGREKYVLERAFSGVAFGPAKPGIRAPSEFLPAGETLAGPLTTLVSRKMQFLPMITRCLVEMGVPDSFRQVGLVEQGAIGRAVSSALEMPRSDSVSMKWGSLRIALKKELYSSDSCGDEAGAVLSAFKEWDKDSSGSIAADELMHVLTGMDGSFGESEVAALLDAADANKDGKVDYKEFVSWIYGIK
eukprot:TRINITY_DN67732_c0_g1_i1.p1 TRINITY_DN67732_c0_g1~~TRINITY_DN67732_c0_g1_i1.p1  ORF type:complete len:540 (-),score=76.82 TRINITY_DN67732_c0_g1_i1:133-1752(-)